MARARRCRLRRALARLHAHCGDDQPRADRPARLGALPLPRRAHARGAALRRRRGDRPRRSRSAPARWCGSSRSGRSRSSCSRSWPRSLARAGERRRCCARSRSRSPRASVVAGPWYGYRAANYSNAIFDRPHVDKPLWERRPASFYSRPGLPDVFSKPYRPHLVNRAWPQTYTDIWGDWYGVFAWRRADAKPPPATNGVARRRRTCSACSDRLALGGWLVLLVRSLRRRDAP